MFKVNEGRADRIIRIILGISLIVVGFFVSGILSIVFFVLGAIGLFTGITGFCGLYALLGINTCSIDKK